VSAATETPPSEDAQEDAADDTLRDSPNGASAIPPAADDTDDDDDTDMALPPGFGFPPPSQEAIDVDAIRQSYEDDLAFERRRAGQRVAIVALVMMMMLIPLFAMM
jgi:hypothetical protein